MKVAVIGAGSSYTPELINGFLERMESFPLTELWLMDIDASRLEIVGGFARRMVEVKDAPFKVALTEDRREAVRGASYVWPETFAAYVAQLKEQEKPEWDVDLIEALHLIPNYYLQYFYYTERKVAAQEKWPPSRAEEVAAIEADLMDYYADQANTEPPADLMKRGGAYYSTVATQLLNAHYNDLGETHVLNVRQGGAVDGWPTEWVLEMPCRVERAGIEPLPAEPLPAARKTIHESTRMMTTNWED